MANLWGSGDKVEVGIVRCALYRLPLPTARNQVELHSLPNLKAASYIQNCSPYPAQPEKSRKESANLVDPEKQPMSPENSACPG